MAAETDWNEELTFPSDRQERGDHLVWGDEFSRVGMTEAAIEEYELALAEDPGNQVAQLHLDQVRNNPDRLAQSTGVSKIRSFEEAYAYGMSAKEASRYTIAAAALTVATVLEPGSPRGWSSLGASLRRLGKVKEARAAYGKSMGIEPNNKPSLVGLAALHRDQGEHFDAIKILKSVLVDEPNNAHALNGLGGVYYDLGRNSESEECFKRATAIDAGRKTAESWLQKLKARYMKQDDNEGVARIDSFVENLRIGK